MQANRSKVSGTSQKKGNKIKTAGSRNQEVKVREPQVC